MIRSKLAAPALLALALLLPSPRAALAQAARGAPVEQAEESSGYIWGYLGGGAFTVAIIYAVCKPTLRHPLNLS